MSFWLHFALSLSLSATPDEISRWIQELGDARYAVRERAIRHLWSAGQDAEGAVRKAADSPDPETARRARELVEKYEWGIFANTPQEVISQIGRYRGSDADGKHDAIRKLVSIGRPAYATLGRLAARADSPEERVVLGQAMAAAVRDFLPQHIRGGDLSAAEELLDACLFGEAAAIVDHYVAVVLLAGRMEAARASWRSRLQQKLPRALDVSVALARAAGDFESARRLATEAKRPELVELTSWDLADWRTLAQLDLGRGDERGSSRANNLSIKALLHRLSGDAAAAEKLLDELDRLESSADAASESFVAAHGLLINERWEPALRRLRDLRSRSDVHFLLFSRGDYADALRVLESKSAEEAVDRRSEIRLTGARALALLGQTAKAVETFDAVAVDSPLNDPERMATVLLYEKSVGQHYLALQHAARYLDAVGQHNMTEVSDQLQGLFSVLVPDRAAEAAIWWRYLRVDQAKESALDRLHAVIKMFTPGSAGEISAATAARFLAAIPSESLAEQAKWSLALAAAYDCAGQSEPARTAYRRAVERLDSPANRLKLGDFERGQRRFAEAAEIYRSVAEKQPMRPLPWYLQARCLAEAGREAESKAVGDLAFRMSVGHFGDRVQLAAELTRYGLNAEARQERDFVLKAVGARDYYSSLLLQLQAQDAAAQKDYSRAAQLIERCLVNALRFADIDVQRSWPLVRSWRLHRARAELAAGRADQAMRHAEAALKLQPIDVSIPIQLGAGLIQHGRKAELDNFYLSVRKMHEERLAAFPDSGLLHNNIAWLMACCRRDLDQAGQHARRATELQPGQPGYFDTLAETAHQKGDRVEAIKAIRTAMALDVSNAYYKTQLRRIEAGDRTSLPAEPEE